MDNGDEFYYTGSGGRNLKEGNKRTGAQTFDQTLTKSNEAIAVTCDCPVDAVNGGEARNWKKSRAIRVVRGFKLQKHHPKYAPLEGYRYDGLYKCVRYWAEKGESGFIVWRFLMRRDDKEAAPWFFIFNSRSIEKSKKINERSESDDELCFGPRKKVQVIIKKRFTPPNHLVELIKRDSRNERNWTQVFDSRKATEAEFIEQVALVFSCVVCQDTVAQPLTTGSFRFI